MSIDESSSRLDDWVSHVGDGAIRIDLSAVRVVEEVLRETPRIAERLGADWPSLRDQILAIADELLGAAGIKARMLTDRLISLGMDSEAADIFREILQRSFTVTEFVDEDRSRMLLASALPHVTPAPPPVRALRRASADLRTALTRRYANVCLTRPDSARVPKSSTIAAGSPYRLRLDIGAWSSESVVENAGEHPIPANLLPQHEAGHCARGSELGMRLPAWR